MPIISEHDIGTSKMTNELEEAYLESCKHNGTTPDDLEYFRRYFWNLFAMIILEKTNRDLRGKK